MLKRSEDLSMNGLHSNLIMTVNGPLRNTELGFCHGHEHLFISRGQSYEINQSLWMDELEKTVAELRLFKDAGGDSIVDAQPVGCGRMEQNLAEASRLSGVNIIASTGFHKLIFYTSCHWIHRLDEVHLKELFVSEIKDGMYVSTEIEVPSQRTKIKPGIIKTAVDIQGITGEYRKLFTAAAETSILTGTPIMCHIEMGANAFEIVEFLTGKGVKPESIILCHLDRVVKDTDYHLQVAKTGVFLEFDTIGRFKYHDDDDEIKLIEKLVVNGYEDKILLGLDTTRSRMRSYGGSLGLDYISGIFLPRLRKHGTSETIIKKMMILNSQNAFSI
jgi:predicted metal-dependent phosphotriesterase family hydrolase